MNGDAAVVAGWWYWPLLWVLIAGGLVPAVYFLATWRPSHLLPPRLRELDTGGWVAAIAVLYLSAAVRAFYGFPVPSWPVAVANIVSGVLVDALLIVRAVHWRRVRRDVKAAAYPPPHG